MNKKSVSSPFANDEARWRAEDDLRTYENWCRIKKDSKRLAAMKRLAKEKLAELQRAMAVKKE